MFLIAFLSFVGAAIQFVFMPLEGGREGTLLPHLLFALAGIQHYRTLFLAWLALKPLVDGFGLTGAASLLGGLPGAAAFVGWTIVASVCQRMGLIRAHGVLGLPTVGITAALALKTTLDTVAPEAGSGSVLALTLIVFILNAAAFSAHALAPIANQMSRGRRLVEAAARPCVLADLQTTVVGLALLWLTLVRSV